MSSSDENSCSKSPICLTEDAFDQLFSASFNHNNDENIDEDEDEEDYPVEELVIEARNNHYNNIEERTEKNNSKVDVTKRLKDGNKVQRSTQNARNINERPGPSPKKPSYSTSSSDATNRLKGIDKKITDIVRNINDRPGPSGEKSSYSGSSSELNNKLKGTYETQKTKDSVRIINETPGPSHGNTSYKSTDIKINSHKNENKNQTLDDGNTNKRPGSPCCSYDNTNKKKKGELYEPPKLKEPNRDIFCWKCHKFGTDIIVCTNCPRIYHFKCSQLEKKPTDWVCFQCNDIRTAESDTRSASMKNLSTSQLNGLLKFVLRRMRQHDGCVHFENNVDTLEYPDYLLYIVHPSCLSDIENNILNERYKSCESLLAETRWLVHNSYIFNTALSELTVVARSIVKMAKHECSEILNCPDCYLHANTLDKNEWFIEPCRIPHILVWAKLKSWPFWPCKVMTSSGNNIDVRFFGDHNRAIVPAEFCYLFSREMPRKQKIDVHLDVAMEEVARHILKLKEKFGEFCYSPQGVTLAPKDEELQRNLLLPGFVKSIRTYISYPKLKKTPENPQLSDLLQSVEIVMQPEDGEAVITRRRTFLGIQTWRFGVGSTTFLSIELKIPQQNSNLELKKNSEDQLLFRSLKERDTCPSNSQNYDINHEDPSSLKTHTFSNNLSIHVERFDVREQNLHPNKYSPRKRVTFSDEIEVFKEKTIEDTPTNDNKVKTYLYKRPSRDYKSIAKSIITENYKNKKFHKPITMECCVKLDKLNFKEGQKFPDVKDVNGCTTQVTQSDHTDHPSIQHNTIYNSLYSNPNVPQENKTSGLKINEPTSSEVNIDNNEPILNDGPSCSMIKERVYKECGKKPTQLIALSASNQIMKRRCNKPTLKSHPNHDSFKQEITHFLNFLKQNKIAVNSVRAKLVRNGAGKKSQIIIQPHRDRFERETVDLAESSNVLANSFSPCNSKRITVCQKNKLPRETVLIQNINSVHDETQKKRQCNNIPVPNTAPLKDSIAMKTFEGSKVGEELSKSKSHSLEHEISKERQTLQLNESSQNEICLVSDAISTEKDTPEVIKVLEDSETLTLNNNISSEISSQNELCLVSNTISTEKDTPEVIEVLDDSETLTLNNNISSEISSQNELCLVSNTISTEKDTPEVIKVLEDSETLTLNNNISSEISSQNELCLVSNTISTEKDTPEVIKVLDDYETLTLNNNISSAMSSQNELCLVSNTISNEKDTPEVIEVLDDSEILTLNNNISSAMSSSNVDKMDVSTSNDAEVIEISDDENFPLETSISCKVSEKIFVSSGETIHLMYEIRDESGSYGIFSNYIPPEKLTNEISSKIRFFRPPNYDSILLKEKNSMYSLPPRKRFKYSLFSDSETNISKLVKNNDIESGSTFAKVVNPKANNRILDKKQTPEVSNKEIFTLEKNIPNKTVSLGKTIVLKDNIPEDVENYEVEDKFSYEKKTPEVVPDVETNALTLGNSISSDVKSNNNLYSKSSSFQKEENSQIISDENLISSLEDNHNDKLAKPNATLEGCVSSGGARSKAIENKAFLFDTDHDYHFTTPLWKGKSHERSMDSYETVPLKDCIPSLDNKSSSVLPDKDVLSYEKSKKNEEYNNHFLQKGKLSKEAVVSTDLKIKLVSHDGEISSSSCQRNDNSNLINDLSNTEFNISNFEQKIINFCIHLTESQTLTHVVKLKLIENTKKRLSLDETRLVELLNILNPLEEEIKNSDNQPRGNSDSSNAGKIRALVDKLRQSKNDLNSATDSQADGFEKDNNLRISVLNNAMDAENITLPSRESCTSRLTIPWKHLGKSRTDPENNKLQSLHSGFEIRMNDNVNPMHASTPLTQASSQNFKVQDSTIKHKIIRYIPLTVLKHAQKEVSTEEDSSDEDVVCIGDLKNEQILISSDDEKQCSDIDSRFHSATSTQRGRSLNSWKPTEYNYKDYHREDYQSKIAELYINYFSGSSSHNDMAIAGRSITNKPQLKNGIESVNQNYAKSKGVLESNRKMSKFDGKESNMDKEGYRVEQEELKTDKGNKEVRTGNKLIIESKGKVETDKLVESGFMERFRDQKKELESNEKDLKSVSNSENEDKTRIDSDEKTECRSHDYELDVDQEIVNRENDQDQYRTDEEDEFVESEEENAIIINSNDEVGWSDTDSDLEAMIIEHRLCTEEDDSDRLRIEKEKCEGCVCNDGRSKHKVFTTESHISRHREKGIASDFSHPVDIRGIKRIRADAIRDEEQESELDSSEEEGDDDEEPKTDDDEPRTDNNDDEPRDDNNGDEPRTDNDDGNDNDDKEPGTDSDNVEARTDNGDAEARSDNEEVMKDNYDEDVRADSDDEEARTDDKIESSRSSDNEFNRNNYRNCSALEIESDTESRYDHEDLSSDPSGHEQMVIQSASLHPEDVRDKKRSEIDTRRNKKLRSENQLKELEAIEEELMSGGQERARIINNQKEPIFGEEVRIDSHNIIKDARNIIQVEGNRTGNYDEEVSVDNEIEAMIGNDEVTSFTSLIEEARYNSHNEEAGTNCNDKEDRNNSHIEQDCTYSHDKGARTDRSVKETRTDNDDKISRDGNEEARAELNNESLISGYGLKIIESFSLHPMYVRSTKIIATHTSRDKSRVTENRGKELQAIGDELITDNDDDDEEEARTDNDDEEAMMSTTSEDTITDYNDEDTITDNDDDDEEEARTDNDDEEEARTDNDDEEAMMSTTSEDTITDYNDEDTITDNDDEEAMMSTTSEGTITDYNDEDTITDNDDEDTRTDNDDKNTYNHDEEARSNIDDKISRVGKEEETGIGNNEKTVAKLNNESFSLCPMYVRSKKVIEAYTRRAEELESDNQDKGLQAIEDELMTDNLDEVARTDNDDEESITDNDDEESITDNNDEESRINIEIESDSDIECNNELQNLRDCDAQHYDSSLGSPSSLTISLNRHYKGFKESGEHAYYSNNSKQPSKHVKNPFEIGMLYGHDESRTDGEEARSDEEVARKYEETRTDDEETITGDELARTDNEYESEIEIETDSGIEDNKKRLSDPFSRGFSSLELHLQRMKEYFAKEINQNDGSSVNFLDLKLENLLEYKLNEHLEEINKADQAGFKDDKEFHSQKLSLDCNYFTQVLNLKTMAKKSSRRENKYDEILQKKVDKFQKRIRDAQKSLYCTVCLQFSKIHCCFFASYCSEKCKAIDLVHHMKKCSTATANLGFNRYNNLVNRDTFYTMIGNINMKVRDLLKCMKRAREKILFHEDEEWIDFFRKNADVGKESYSYFENNDASSESDSEISDSNSNHSNIFDYEWPLEVILDTFSNSGNSDVEEEHMPTNYNNSISQRNANIEGSICNTFLNSLEENCNKLVLKKENTVNEYTPTNIPISLDITSEEISTTKSNTKCNLDDLCQQSTELSQNQSISSGSGRCPEISRSADSHLIDSLTTIIASTSLSPLKKFDVIFEPTELKKFKLNRQKTFSVNHSERIKSNENPILTPEEKNHILNDPLDLQNVREPEGMNTSGPSKTSFNINNSNELILKKPINNLEVIISKKVNEGNKVNLPIFKNIKPGIRKILARPHTNYSQPPAKPQPLNRYISGNLVVEGQSSTGLYPLILLPNLAGSAIRLPQEATTHHLTTQIHPTSMKHNTRGDNFEASSSHSLLISDKCKKILASSLVSGKNGLLPKTKLPIIFPKANITNVNRNTSEFFE